MNVFIFQCSSTRTGSNLSGRLINAMLIGLLFILKEPKYIFKSA